jgi:death-on-curing protein
VAEYLTTADVIGLHLDIMARTGSGSQGLRDEGLLESAVLRPQMAAYYEGADLVRQAALLVIGISQNQPFVDGNKRTAFHAFITFLRINDHEFTGDPFELVRRLEHVAERTGSLEQATDTFGAWLRDYVTEKPAP